MVNETSPSLTIQEAGNPGCGLGTPDACFALIVGSEGLVCGVLAQPAIAQMAGLQLNWRVNRDSEDGQVWCPREVLVNSKRPPSAS